MRVLEAVGERLSPEEQPESRRSPSDFDAVADLALRAPFMDDATGASQFGKDTPGNLPRDANAQMQGGTDGELLGTVQKQPRTGNAKGLGRDFAPRRMLEADGDDHLGHRSGMSRNVRSRAMVS